MTERGLPIVDAPVACPFVAFEDDRDERATAPDHRHRCYAEIVPAPRALAHQEAYCLSSAFPVCPTFQDWARREAARARDLGPARGRRPADDEGRELEPPPLIRGGPGSGGSSGYSPDAGLDEDEEPVYEDPRPRRNPQRGWASPPPWLRRADADAAGADAAAAAFEGEGEDEDELADDAGSVGEGGLAGSFADRLTSSPESPPRARGGAAGRGPGERPTWHAGDRWDSELEPADEDAEWEADDRAGPQPPSRREPAPSPGLPPVVRERHRERVNAPQPERDDRPAVGASRSNGDRHRELAAPSWERPARLEAYPSLRSRRMPAFTLSPIVLGLIALLIAALVLFLLPGFLGFGGPGPAASPTPSVAASLPAEASLAPTVAPEATQQIYLVQSGDTMSRIATKFHIPLATLIDANKTNIPNPNSLQIGDAVIIPTTTPTALPAASASP